MEQHIHSIIIIRKGDKFLNYYDENWKIYLFPNMKGNNIEEIKKKYNTENVKLLFEKVHEKYSLTHLENRTYHHYFYEIDTDINGKYFSLEELLEHPDIKKYNGDIIGFIDDFYKENYN